MKSSPKVLTYMALHLALILFFTEFSASAQTITEIINVTGDGAGNPLDNPRGIAVDGSGNVYVAGEISDNAFKITPGGVITEIIDPTGDGAGNKLDRPDMYSVAVDGSGNAYVTGLQSGNAFKITSGGVITEIIDATGDGNGNLLYNGLGVAVDGSGNVYVAGWASDNVFKITSGGVITEIIDATGDGAGNNLEAPGDIEVDGSGNVYVAGYDSDNIFKITPGGVITEIIDATGDGAGNPLSKPTGIAADGSGNVYVAGWTSNNVFKITPGGVITEIIDATGDGTGNNLSGAGDIAVDGSGNVYVTGFFSTNAFKITPGGVVTEIIDAAGDGTNTLIGPRGIAADAVGNVFVAGLGTDNVFMIALGPSNQPPVAVCQDVTVSAGENCEADVSAVQVDNGSYDPDGDAITLSLSPAGPYPKGDTGITLTVSDGQASSTCTATITVVDDIAPTLSVDSEPVTLWPPNHKYHVVDIAAYVLDVADNCADLNADDVVITSVTSDEPDDANGDGKHLNDIVITSCGTVELRAERMGGSNGRVYTVNVQVDDGNGNSVAGSLTVQVPHDKKDTAIDDGVMLSVNNECDASLAKGSTFGKPEHEVTPDGFELAQNYPNPFNPTTTIFFALPKAGNVTLAIYNMQGQLIQTLVNGQYNMGQHHAVWNGMDAKGFKVSSGVYIYTLKTNNFVASKKMLLMQ